MDPFLLHQTQPGCIRAGKRYRERGHQGKGPGFIPTSVLGRAGTLDQWHGGPSGDSALVPRSGLGAGVWQCGECGLMSLRAPCGVEDEKVASSPQHDLCQPRCRAWVVSSHALEQAKAKPARVLVTSIAPHTVVPERRKLLLKG